MADLCPQATLITRTEFEIVRLTIEALPRFSLLAILSKLYLEISRYHFA